MPGAGPPDEFAGFTPVVALSESFDAMLGLELVDWDSAGTDVMRGRVSLRAELLTATGALHGGVPAAIAEALASRGTAREAIPAGMMPIGLANDTTTLRAITAGAVNGEARVLSRGADAWVWTVEMRDDEGTLCAISRVIIAIRAMGRMGR